MRAMLAILAAGSILFGSAVHAAPVATNIVVEIRIANIGQISFSGAAAVSVTGGTLSIAAGAISLAGPIVVPVTSTTTVTSISASGISNLAGTFSVGGVTAQASGEVCGGGPAAGTACNAGGGFGGSMGFVGMINIALIPNLVVIPVDLEDSRIGLGGATSVPWTYDGALFSTGVGSINTGTNVLTSTGSSSPLSLVSPTYTVLAANTVPVFTTITFTTMSLPVPEPGFVTLAGIALASVLLLAFLRR